MARKKAIKFMTRLHERHPPFGLQMDFEVTQGKNCIGVCAGCSDGYKCILLYNAEKVFTYCPSNYHNSCHMGDVEGCEQLKPAATVKDLIKLIEKKYKYFDIEFIDFLMEVLKYLPVEEKE